MIYITGDVHGDFDGVAKLCKERATTRGDLLVVLGDAGINYHGVRRDKHLKQEIAKLPIALLCIHGNHEQRPDTIAAYREAEKFGGRAFWEPEFPNLFFAKDGEIYELGGRRCIAIGGAYSVDKHIRLRRGMNWWPDEQPSAETKKRVEQQLQASNWKIDLVLSHTCPYKYIPREVFLDFIDQSMVDDRTEIWLDYIEDRLEYSLWFCGHYHTDKSVDGIRFMFNDFWGLPGIEPS